MFDSLLNSLSAACSSWKQSLFSEFFDSQLYAVSSHKKLVSHQKGQNIYYEGSRPSGIFCINSGVVKIYKTASNGKEQIIHLAKKGEFLGCAALLGEGNYSHSSMVIEDAQICFVPADVFMKTLLHNREFSLRIAKSLSREIGRMEEKLVNANHKSIRERLAQALLELCNSFGIEENGTRKIDLALKRDELAGIVGTTTESVIRLLSEFQKSRLISLEGKKIILIDQKRLVRLSDFYRSIDSAIKYSTENETVRSPFYKTAHRMVFSHSLPFALKEALPGLEDYPMLSRNDGSEVF